MTRGLRLVIVFMGLRRLVKERWGKLTDDDLEVIRGKREQLVGRIQERYGIVKEEAEKQVNEFAKTFREESKNEATSRAETEAAEGNVYPDSKDKVRRAGQS